jgi:hypothetical protein
MPRKARIDSPGALHPIIVRGINRRKTFSNINYVKKEVKTHAMDGADTVKVGRQQSEAPGIQTAGDERQIIINGIFFTTDEVFDEHRCVQ